MQELIEGCVAVRLLASGKEFIARARHEERAMNWKGAACCYVNAARQLGHLPGQTELRAKALGRAGLCFSRADALEQAAMCYHDGWWLCVFLGNGSARNCLWRNIMIIKNKIYNRRYHVDVRTVPKKTSEAAAVGVPLQAYTRAAGRGRAISELRTDGGAAEMVGSQVRDHGDDQGCGHGLCGAADVQPPLPSLRDRQTEQHAV